jgi:hypothetical protein
MKKSYIKMNNGNILSLGNIINSIKKISNNNNAMQTEIFCSIFGVNEINTTPGSLSYYLFDNIDEFFKKMIYQALKEYQNKKQTVFVSSVLSQKNIYKK